MIIIGAKGKLNIEETLEKLKKIKGISQIFDASCICGREHIEIAYERAKRAFEEGRNKCRSIEMEMLLYASCKRQIKDAMDFVGAKKHGEYAIFLDGLNEEEAIKFVKNELKLEIDENVLKPSIEKLKKFVDEKELRTVDKSFYFDLIYEKIAMVELTK
ncbi:MAG TPA: hypothetical protein ENI33_06530 [Thermoplasmatales archaeon]|nr:hypothetical protein [Thermoplasmatales archaeon]